MAGVVNLQLHQIQIYSGGFSLREREGVARPRKLAA